MPFKDSTSDITKVTFKHTKKQIFAAYQQLLRQIQGSNAKQPGPKQQQQALNTLKGLSSAKITTQINELKTDLNTMLTSITNRMCTEISRFEQIQLAIEIKQRELEQIYQISSDLESLQSQIKDKTRKKQDLENEIINIQQQKTKQQEQLQYDLDMRQQKARHKFEVEMARLLTEKENIEQQMTARKNQIEAKEQFFASIEAQVNEFPRELEAAIENAVKENTQRIKLKNDYEKSLLQKDLESEKKILNTRIKALEKTIKDQARQIDNLTSQQVSAFATIQALTTKKDSQNH